MIIAMARKSATQTRSQTGDTQTGILPKYTPIATYHLILSDVTSAQIETTNYDKFVYGYPDLHQFERKHTGGKEIGVCGTVHLPEADHPR